MRGQGIPGAGVTLGCGVGFGWGMTGLGAGATTIRKVHPSNFMVKSHLVMPITFTWKELVILAVTTT